MQLFFFGWLIGLDPGDCQILIDDEVVAGKGDEGLLLHGPMDEDAFLFPELILHVFLHLTFGFGELLFQFIFLLLADLRLFHLRNLRDIQIKDVVNIDALEEGMRL